MALGPGTAAGGRLQQSAAARHGQQRQQRPRQRRCFAVRAEAAAPHETLGVPQGSSRRAIRTAYIEQMKRLHPDVSGEADTTAEAAALNAAYEALMAGERRGGMCEASVDRKAERRAAARQRTPASSLACPPWPAPLCLAPAGYSSNSRGSVDEGEEEEEDPLQVLDLPEAEPDLLFVDPWACANVNPLQVWPSARPLG